MKFELDRTEICQAVANYLAMKYGSKTFNITLIANIKLDSNGKPKDDLDICAKVEDCPNV